jgi:hypothetical protein
MASNGSAATTSSEDRVIDRSCFANVLIIVFLHASGELGVAAGYGEFGSRQRFFWLLPAKGDLPRHHAPREG